MPEIELKIGSGSGIGNNTRDGDGNGDGNGNGSNPPGLSFPNPSIDSFSLIGNVQDVTKLTVEQLKAELDQLQNHRLAAISAKRESTRKKNEKTAKQSPAYTLLLANLKGKPQAYIDKVVELAKAQGLI